MDETSLVEAMHLNLGSVRDIHIVPVPEGAKSDGLGKILIGTLILATAFIAAPIGAAAAGALGPTALGVGQALGTSAFLGVSFGQIAALGGMIALAGISQLISPTPKVKNYADREKADQRGSFLINSRVNTVEEGLTVPIVYGRTRVGSSVISAGLSSESALTSGQITVTEGWSTNFKIYRWKGTGVNPSTSAYSVHFKNNIGDSSLPNEFEDVTFYGLHTKPDLVSGVRFKKPLVYLQTASLGADYFDIRGVTSPIAAQLGSLGFPYEDQYKRNTGGFFHDRTLTQWEQDLPLVPASYPGLLNPTHASPWSHHAMWTMAAGSLDAGGRHVKSALEYEDANNDIWFQLVIGRAAEGAMIPTTSVVPENHFDTLTVQVDDTDRTTIYELDRTAATSVLLYDGSRAWRWALGTADIASIAAPVSAQSDVFFWVRVEKTPLVTITHTLVSGQYQNTKIKLELTGSTLTSESYGYIEKLGATGIGQSGPEYNSAVPGGFTQAGVSRTNALPVRGSDNIAYFGGTGNHWSLVLNTPGRPQDWIATIEVRKFSDNSLLTSLATSDATFFNDTFVFQDSTEGTLWMWEALTGQPRNQVGSALLNGAVKLVIKYHDRTALVN